MSEQNCGNCDAFRANPDLKVKAGQPHLGSCHAKPPSLVQGMVQVSSPFDPRGQQVQPGFQGVFVPTHSLLWCREWKPVWAKNAAKVIDHDEQQPPAAA